MMNENKLLAVGIDLGTTYSCISYIDEYGKPLILKNMEGDSITPSVVQFTEEGEIVVGKIAKNEKGLYNQDRTVDLVKRSMGEKNWRHFVGEEEYTAEEISSYIIKKIITDASTTLGRPVTQAIVTCPAYFGRNEIKATSQAGLIAGLKGYLEDGIVNIIPEPTAAAFYYGLEKTSKEQVVMVYDLGGGTFDVTLLEIKNGSVKGICVDGNKNLGGKDWDDKLINHCLEIAKEQGLNLEEFKEEPTPLYELQLKIEDAKKALTSKTQARVLFRFREKNYRIELTRDKFDEITKAELGATIALCDHMLSEAKGKGFERFDRILLVGGSTKMPQVQAILEMTYPGIPIEFNEPDEAVAKGAALFAQKLIIEKKISDELFKIYGENKSIDDIKKNNPEKIKEVVENISPEFGIPAEKIEELANTEIVNVTSKSFGVVIVTDKASMKEMLATLIVKNSSLPTSKTDQFVTLEGNQANVELRVMETTLTEATVELSECIEIGKAILTLPSGLPKGSPIEVTFDFDQAGLFRFSGVEKTSGNHIEGEIDASSVMTKEEVEKAKKRSDSMTFA